jgi:hypothetical protein
VPARWTGGVQCGVLEQAENASPEMIERPNVRIAMLRLRREAEKLRGGTD